MDDADETALTKPAVPDGKPAEPGEEPPIYLELVDEHGDPKGA